MLAIPCLRGLCQHEVDDAGRDGKQGAVEAVEHTAVTREDVAAVLDAKLPLDEALYEVTPSADDNNRQGKAQPAA